MKLDQLHYRELAEGMHMETVGAARIFTPSGTLQDDSSISPPRRTVFNEADVKAAERDSYKKGFLEGTQEGRKQLETEQTEIDRNLSQMLDRFVQAVSPLCEDYRQMALQVQQMMPKTALAIARKVAGESLNENAQTVISDIATRCCETLIHEPKITITVHTSLGNALERRLQQLSVRLPATTDIIIQHNPDMPVTDCRIEWQHGTMERSTEALWQQMEQIVSGMAATAARDVDVHMETLRAPAPAQETTAKQKE